MVKDKPNSTRIYDEDGFRKRAACICVRDDQEDEILLVSSSADRDRWIVPGGGIEPNEDSSEAALREVMEEAGVIGRLTRCLGSFENPEGKHRTSVYVLNVTEELVEWEDCGRRQRKWFKLADALTELSYHRPIECEFVRTLIKKNQCDCSNNNEESKGIHKVNLEVKSGCTDSTTASTNNMTTATNFTDSNNSTL